MISMQFSFKEKYFLFKLFSDTLNYALIKTKKSVINSIIQSFVESREWHGF